MRNILTDDHIYFGTLGLICVFSLLLMQSVSGHTPDNVTATASTSSPTSQKTQAQTKTAPIKMRASVMEIPETMYQKVAENITRNGHSCPFLVGIEPLTLSGMYQVRCEMDDTGTMQKKFFYNKKSGFISLMR